MSTAQQQRRPAGTPTGGQFADRRRGEAVVRLSPASEAYGDQPSVPDGAYDEALDEILSASTTRT